MPSGLSTSPIRMALAALALTTALVGCSSTAANTPNGKSDSKLAAAVGPPSLAIIPADKSQGVAPDTTATVNATNGSINKVSLHVVGDSTEIPGLITNDHQTWIAQEDLLPGANYELDTSATGPSGDVTNASSHFTTISGDRLTSEAVPGDGSTVGVGMPIKVTFSTPIPDAQQSALVSHIQIQSDPPVIGAWHWFSPSEVHFRPENYWPAHTKVTVNANLQGVNAGNNTWGFANWSESFTVGDKHVSIIDDTTDQMQVYQNDALINTWPVSMGKPGFLTISGTLVVLYRQYDVRMKSCATFGGDACNPASPNYYDDDVYWDTAISSDGYFIHAAPWSVYAQGSYDVSHGCVNLSTDRATTFYQWSQTGDVVVIKNTGHVADAGDGEGDWQIPFSQFANSGGAPTSTPVSQPGGV